jgi:hypothetical protein
MDVEIETNLKLSEISDDEMDIQYESLIETAKTDTSFHQNSFSVNETNDENTPINPYYQTLDSDWLIRISRAPQLDFNSKCIFNSFPFIEKLPMDQ